VVLGALVYRSMVWCGAVGYVSGLRGVHIKFVFLCCLLILVFQKAA